jgi:hypothetical protein
MGGSDELGAGIAAGVAKLTGDEKDYGAIYDEMMGGLSDERKAYTEAHPGEALGLNVAGGLLTGGLGASKALGTQAVKNAPKLAKALAASGVGATEGGIAGALSADQGKRGKGAAEGAGLGAIIPGLGQVGKLGVDKLSKSRDISEGVVGEIYRDVIGESFGGGRIRDVAQESIGKAEKKVRLLTKAAKRVKEGGKAKIKRSEQVIRQQKDDAVEGLNKNSRQEAFDASTPQRLPPEVRQEIAELPPQDAVDVLQAHWTKQGFSEAKAKTFTLDADAFERQMKNVLNDSPSLREAAPNFVRDLMGDFNKAFKRDPDIVTPGAGMPGVTSTVTKAVAKPAPTGVMQGDELMELRNKYARDANTTGDSLKRAAYQKIKTRIDNMITDQLDGEDLARYQDDMSRWESFSTLRNATGKAANRKGGDFTPDEWHA